LILNRYDNVYPLTQSLSLYSASVVTIDSTPQVNPTTGSLWWNTNDGNLYVYYYYDSGGFSGSTWVSATSLAIEATTAVSASYAATASLALTASAVSGSDVIVSGSIQASGSINLSGSLVFSNFATIEFLDDAAAAAGAVPIGGVYRSGNLLAIRLV
jgi:hypothetical protein